MKQIIVLLIWYFASGQQIYSFETKAQCEKLHKYMIKAGMLISDCDEAKWNPLSGTSQSTSGANSPAIIGGKGGVTFTIDGQKEGKVK